MPQPPQQPFVITIEQAAYLYGPTLDTQQKHQLATIMNDALRFHYADGDPLRAIGFLAYAASTWKLDPNVDQEQDFPMVRALAALVHIVADSWYAERAATAAAADMERHANWTVLPTEAEHQDEQRDDEERG